MGWHHCFFKNFHPLFTGVSKVVCVPTFSLVVWWDNRKFSVLSVALLILGGMGHK
jgi:hypothetical protein